MQKDLNTALSGTQVQLIAGYPYPVLKYSETLKYKTLDSLLSHNGGVIILYEFERNMGHFCCMFMHDANTASWFDPFAYPVDDELDYIVPKNVRRQFGETQRHLSKLMYESPYKLTFSDSILQSDDTSVCGRYCGYRLRLKHLSDEEFDRIFSSKRYHPDVTIVMLTNKYIR